MDKIIKHWWNCWLVHKWGVWVRIDKLQSRTCLVCGFNQWINDLHEHDWSVWRDYGELTKDGLIIGEIQERNCIECNYKEIRPIIGVPTYKKIV